MHLVLTPTISVELGPPQKPAKPARSRQIVTGPDMILIFWIARLALEDRYSYDFVKKELNLKGDETARLYDAIRNFLGDGK